MPSFRPDGATDRCRWRWGYGRQVCNSNVGAIRRGARRTPVSGFDVGERIGHAHTLPSARFTKSRRSRSLASAHAIASSSRGEEARLIFAARRRSAAVRVGRRGRIGAVTPPLITLTRHLIFDRHHYWPGGCLAPLPAPSAPENPGYSAFAIQPRDRKPEIRDDRSLHMRARRCSSRRSPSRLVAGKMAHKNLNSERNAADVT